MAENNMSTQTNRQNPSNIKVDRELTSSFIEAMSLVIESILADLSKLILPLIAASCDWNLINSGDLVSPAFCTETRQT